MAVGETDEYNRTSGHCAKLNAAIEGAGAGGAVAHGMTSNTHTFAGAAANQIPGMNAGGVGMEWKTLQGTTNAITVTNAAGSVTLNIGSDVVTLTGSQALSNKTLTTPTIGNFTNAQHNHTNAANGGTLAGFLPSGVKGDLVWHNGTSWVAISHSGVTGQVLRTSGSSTILWENIPSQFPAGVKGTIVWHDGLGWSGLGVGSQGDVLTVGAASAVGWTAPTGASLPSGTKGQILWHNGTSWVVLAVGTEGKVLTVGAANAIDWSTPSSGAQTWTSIASFTTTAANAGRLTLGADYMASVQPGTPIRVLDSTGYEQRANTGGGAWTVTSGLTGLVAAALRSDGIIRCNCVSLGGSDYRIDLYRGANTTTAQLIGHTGTITGFGTHTITADNTSGLGGNIVVSGDTFSAGYVDVCFFKWMLCDAITTTQLDLVGPALDTGSAKILAVWYGDSTRVVVEKRGVPGPYSFPGTTTVFESSLGAYVENTGPALRVAQLRFAAGALSANPPKLNVQLGAWTAKVCTSNSYQGIEPLSGGSWGKTTTTIDPAGCRWERDARCEVTATETSTGDDTLSVQIVGILE
jgi:hypothetical protein